jgi:hypothetical protein
MSEHHFIIKFDTEHGWAWDVATEQSVFTDGTIYVNGKWQNPNTNKIGEIDMTASSVIAQMVGLLNSLYSRETTDLVKKIVKGN